MSLIAEAVDPVAASARHGLCSTPKTLSPWLFYDEAGSQLFEDITELPEYYLTRTERQLFERHAEEIFLALGAPLSVVELGAGTATKTGLLLRALTRFQQGVLYQPIDVSASALDEAQALEEAIDGVSVRQQVANYVTEAIRIEREPGRKVLALYIGSSIGNFTPDEAKAILGNLRSQLHPGDALLLGTDLAPGRKKSVASLLAAYDDAAGVTAAFNLNVLVRLNRDLGADFNLDAFAHEARWNAADSRIEMHLRSACDQLVTIPASASSQTTIIGFAAGETIHTENSYKFTPASIAKLLEPSGFSPMETFHDDDCLYALTLAKAV